MSNKIIQDEFLEHVSELEHLSITRIADLQNQANRMQECEDCVVLTNAELDYELERSVYN